MFAHPWNDTEAPFSRATVEHIKEQLSAINLPYLKEKPDDSVVKAVELLLSRIKKQQEESSVPWILAVSRDPVFVNTCARIIPASFALNTSMSSYSVNLEQLSRCLLTRKPSDDFEMDQAGEMLYKAKKSGLLVLENVSEYSQYVGKSVAGLVPFFTYRVSSKLPTIFTATYSGTFLQNTALTILDKIEKNLGTSIRTMVEQYSELVSFKNSEQKKMNVVEVTL